MEEVLIDLSDFKVSPNSKNRLETQNIIGGKGSGLIKIAEGSLAMPKTWVVPTTVFDSFLETIPPKAETLSLTELSSKAVMFIKERLSEALKVLPNSKFAVRSSATIEDSIENSFAGMFESKLNVSKRNLVKYIAEVWLSGLGERVQLYGNKNLWPRMAVLIQIMIKPYFSGVCFSKNPSPRDIRDKDKIVMELVPGVGDRLVQGEVKPFTFAVSPNSVSSAFGNVWIKQVLEAVSLLVEITGTPVDVEFAVDQDEKVWILQQRPITFCLDSNNLNLENYRKVYKRTLCPLDIEFLIEGCSRYLAPYLELSHDLHEWLIMTTNQVDNQQELWVEENLNREIVKAIGEHIGKDNAYLDRLASHYLQIHRMILNCQSMVWSDVNNNLKDRFIDFANFAIFVNAHYYLPVLVIEALSEIVLSIMKRISPETADEDLFVLSTRKVTSLAKLYSDRSSDLRKTILLKEGKIPDNYEDLEEDFQIEVKLLESAFGFLKCHMPYEKPYSTEEIFSHVKEALPKEEPYDTSKDEKYTLLLGRYKSCIEWSKAVNHLIRWLAIRNQEMEYLYYLYAKAQPLLMEVSETVGITLKEVWATEKCKLVTALDTRNHTIKIINNNKLTIFHDGCKVQVRDDLNLIFRANSTNENSLKGRTVYGTGIIKGRVYVAFTPDKLKNLNFREENVIIVTGMTTPDFVPFLKGKLTALVTDEGGILCHASVIARELKLPCLVGTGMATERLSDGMKITLDLDRGEVAIDG